MRIYFGDAILLALTGETLTEWDGTPLDTKLDMYFIVHLTLIIRQGKNNVIFLGIMFIKVLQSGQRLVTVNHTHIVWSLERIKSINTHAADYINPIIAVSYIAHSLFDGSIHAGLHEPAFPAFLHAAYFFYQHSMQPSTTYQQVCILCISTAF